VTLAWLGSVWLGLAWLLAWLGFWRLAWLGSAWLVGNLRGVGSTLRPEGFEITSSNLLTPLPLSSPFVFLPSSRSSYFLPRYVRASTVRSSYKRDPSSAVDKLLPSARRGAPAPRPRPPPPPTASPSRPIPRVPVRCHSALLLPFLTFLWCLFSRSRCASTT
jgi:hypothetical protein